MDYSDNATRALLDSYRDSIADAQATHSKYAGNHSKFEGNDCPVKRDNRTP